jgi:hypothetical protein
VVSLGEGDFAQIGVNLGGRRLLSKPTILRAGPFAALNWVQRRTNSTWSPKVERGERESVNAFWEEVKKTGAPLIEPIAGDRENMAVTFVWKGTPNPRDRWKCELQQQPVIQRSNAKSRLDTLALAITWYENSRINNTGDQRGSVGTRIKSTLLLGVRRTRDHAYRSNLR